MRHPRRSHFRLRRRGAEQRGAPLFRRGRSGSALSCFGATAACLAQVRRLVDALRDCVGRADAPVLIDQEGGRVARLRPPYWRRYPSAGANCFVARSGRGRGGPARRAADRRRSRPAQDHRRLLAGRRPAGCRRRPGDRRPRLRRRARTAWRGSAGRSAKDCWRGGVLPVHQAHSRPRPRPRRQPLAPARRWRPVATSCRSPISRRFARSPRCRGR